MLTESKLEFSPYGTGEAIVTGDEARARMIQTVLIGNPIIASEIYQKMEDFLFEPKTEVTLDAMRSVATAAIGKYLPDLGICDVKVVFPAETPTGVAIGFEFYSSAEFKQRLLVLAILRKNTFVVSKTIF